jgi:hypothetical protein
LQYQWVHDGIALADDGRITGAASTALAISNVVAADGGLYSVLVSNSWGSVLSSNATLQVYVIDRFAWDAIPSPRFIGVPFPVRLQAVDAGGAVIGLFQGSVALASTTGISVAPSVSGAFVLGTWTGSVTITQAVAGLVLVADDGQGHLGYANPINLISLPAMTVVQSGASVILGWPTNAAAFAPETSADTSSWSPLTSPIDVVGDLYQTRVSTADPVTFFRLRFVGP